MSVLVSFDDWLQYKTFYFTPKWTRGVLDIVLQVAEMLWKTIVHS